jgi:MFS transporter, FSR family, fosmidomycin resistance protein
MQKIVPSIAAAGQPSAMPVSGMSQPSAVAFPVLIALSFAHLLNDLMQSLVPAIYPVIKSAFNLDFAQIGLITFTFQIAACLFQPLVGMYTDKKPQPYSLVVGMAFTLVGLLVLAKASSYAMLLLGAGLVGTGSSIFHPEATRMARKASGGQHGLAQSLFQVGGQSGAAVGPLLAAFIVVPRGQESLVWFSAVALLGMLILWQAGRWASNLGPAPAKVSAVAPAGNASPEVHQTGVILAVAILVALMFSKNAYSASFSSFYTFYLIEKFGVSVQNSQYLLFLFLAATALGTLIGGPIGDRIGRRKIIWISILGALPFTLMLPYANLFWTATLTVVIALIMASAFGAILVYGMELLPGRVGLIAGLFYGLSFGLGGISAALLGRLADHTGLPFVYQLCSFLPAVGLLAWALPDIGRERQ